jgi:hypothetical protein
VCYDVGLEFQREKRSVSGAEVLEEKMFLFLSSPFGLFVFSSTLRPSSLVAYHHPIMFSFKSFVVLAIFVSLVHSHICVWEPRQRGPMSIGQPGDPSCYRPYPLCGNQSAEAPLTKLVGG